MNVKKQHIVLHLIKSGRYGIDKETGNVISYIGKEPKVMAPIQHLSGYLQYRLDVGFNDSLTVYGQGFVYLATYLKTFDPTRVIHHVDKNRANNHPLNLRCITERENIKDNFGDVHGLPKGFIRKRLAPDEINGVIEGHKLGISAVKLAQRYSVTRQTIARIIMKTKESTV